MASRDEKKVGSPPSRDDSTKVTNPGGLSSYLLQRVFGYADRSSWILNGVAFLAAIGAGVPLPLMDLIFGQFVTLFNSFAVGETEPSEYFSEVKKYSLYMVYLFVAKFVLVYIHTVCISIAAIRTTKALRVGFLKSLLRQNIAFFDSDEAGSPSVKVTTSANLVNQGISEKLSLTISGISTIVTAFVIAFAVQWKLTLITISVFPVIVVVTAICIGIDAKQEGRILSIHSKAGNLAEEAFSSIATVHAFWLHPVMITRHEKLLADAERQGMKKSANWAVMFSIEFFCVFAGYGLAFWRGIRMYASGEIESPGKVVTVVFAVIVAATTLTQIAPQFLVLSKAISSADELFKTIDRQSEIDAFSTDGASPTQCAGDIEVNDVHFAYPSRPNDKILNGLSLTVPARKTTALVGTSGSGKSTIIGLLEKWYEQASGSLTIDGVETRNLNTNWLRTHVRLVQQEPVLFSGTIFENVANGLIGTAEDTLPYAQKLSLVQRACKDAFAHDFITKTPQGYDSPVGERARNLSGGQKQRIAIARSIISNPPILLLDEATSALDPKSEGVVQKALDNVSASRTTVVIAHKLSTIQNADNIVVMGKGVVLEQGTHAELIAKNGAYSCLVKAQDLAGAEQTDKEDFTGSDPKDSLERKLSISRTCSEGVTFDMEATRTRKTTYQTDYGLLRCIGILIREREELWNLFIVVASLCICGGGTYPAQAVVFARTFEAFQLRGSAAATRGDFWALMFFVVALANLVIYGILGWVSNVICQSLTRRYRYELFKTTLHQKMDFFDQDNNAVGALTSMLSTSATNLQELLGFNIALILINIVNILSSSILGIVFGWKLGLVCVFGALPPLLCGGYARIRLELKLDDATSARFADSAAVAAEAISAIRTVASLTLERTILKNYEERLSDVAAKSTRTLVFTMLWYASTQSLNFLAMALGFWYGGKLVSTGEYTTTQFFVIFTAILFGGEAAAALFQYTTSITKARKAANVMFGLRLSACDPEEDMRPSPSNDNEKSRAPAAIDCHHLAFAYPSQPNANVLQGINVSIAPGKFVAFVGPSGCGKSTMIALLSRFYDPTSGSIALDGIRITEKTPREFRRQLALVQQEPVLYDGSIRDNVALGIVESREATDAEVEEACARANILDFVRSLPEGVNTSVGGRGTQLSGGQRQRVAIARAIIRDPKILLLDEATSALDTESEKVVQEALLKSAQDGKRTTIAVAHRLSTIRDADCIFVFENGRIAEFGTHTALLEKRGRYFAMCEIQALNT